MSKNLIILGAVAVGLGVLFLMSKKDSSDLSSSGGGSGGAPSIFDAANMGSMTGGNPPALTSGLGSQTPAVAPAVVAPAATYSTPNVGAPGSLESAIASASFNIANQLNAGIGADIFQPTASSININPAIKGASLTTAQKMLDTAVLGSGAIAAGAGPYSQTQGGVAFGGVDAQKLAMGSSSNFNPVFSNTSSSSSNSTKAIISGLGLASAVAPAALSAALTSTKAAVVAAPKISLTTGAAIKK